MNGTVMTPDQETTGTGGLAVELAGLHRHFGDVRALDGLDLRIEPGEMVVLLGPSGCGKTTALRILAGLDHQDSGTVTVGGRDVSRVPANKRDMGMVFQAYSLFPHLTVAENVAFGLKMRGRRRKERRRRAADVLELVGLGQHRDRYAHQLSGGQQQRVALARALAVEPSVLLLDEPLSALDAKVRVQLRDEIRKVQLEVGTTTLFVTHDQEEALAVADRVGVMNAGRLEQLAPPAELYSAPATAFVGEFVGLSNRVPATVEAGHAQVLGRRVPVLDGSAVGEGLALVRPESLGLEPAQDDAATVATVVSVNFLGPVSRVHVALADGHELVAQLASSAATDLRPGDRVAVTVAPSPVLVVGA
jgi:putative spermidine/putrescine transport system ATP-binding protein